MRQLPAAIGDKRRTFPQVVSSTLLTTDAVAHDIVHRTTLTEADVQAVLVALREVLSVQLASGARVKIDGIGTFSLSLRLTEDGLQKVAEGRKVRGKDIALKNICYRPASELLFTTGKAIDAMPASQISANLSTEMADAEVRLQRAMEFIAKNGRMYLADYVRLTQLSRSTAWRELNSFVSQGKLRKEGRGVRVCYCGT